MTEPPPEKQRGMLELKSRPPVRISKNEISRLEQLAASMPWRKLERLLSKASEHTSGQPFQNPVLLMKLLVLQELFQIDLRQLPTFLGKHYALFVFFIPGMERGIPEQTEIERLKRCFQEMNLFHPFLSECAELLGLNITNLAVDGYHGHQPHLSSPALEALQTPRPLYDLACPQCGRKNLHIRKRPLVERIFKRKTSYACNACSSHFDL